MGFRFDSTMGFSANYVFVRVTDAEQAVASIETLAEVIRTFMLTLGYEPISSGQQTEEAFNISIAYHPSEKWIGVDISNHESADEYFGQLAKTVAEKFDEYCCGVSIFDSDVVTLNLYKGQTTVDLYCNQPDYFAPTSRENKKRLKGDAQQWLPLLSNEKEIKTLNRVMRSKSVFAEEIWGGVTKLTHIAPTLALFENQLAGDQSHSITLQFVETGEHKKSREARKQAQYRPHLLLNQAYELWVSDPFFLTANLIFYKKRYDQIDFYLWYESSSLDRIPIKKAKLIIGDCLLEPLIQVEQIKMNWRDGRSKSFETNRILFDVPKDVQQRMTEIELETQLVVELESAEECKEILKLYVLVDNDQSKSDLVETYLYIRNWNKLIAEIPWIPKYSDTQRQYMVSNWNKLRMLHNLSSSQSLYGFISFKALDGFQRHELISKIISEYLSLLKSTDKTKFYGCINCPERSHTFNIRGSAIPTGKTWAKFVKEFAYANSVSLDQINLDYKPDLENWKNEPLGFGSLDVPMNKSGVHFSLYKRPDLDSAIVITALRNEVKSVSSFISFVEDVAKSVNAQQAHVTRVGRSIYGGTGSTPYRSVTESEFWSKHHGDLRGLGQHMWFSESILPVELKNKLQAIGTVSQVRNLVRFDLSEQSSMAELEEVLLPLLFISESIEEQS